MEARGVTVSDVEKGNTFSLLWAKNGPFERVFVPPTIKSAMLEADPRLIASRYMYLLLHMEPALDFLHAS